MSLDGTITLEDLNQDADHEVLYGTDSDEPKAEDTPAEKAVSEEPDNNADEVKDEGEQEVEAKAEAIKADDQPEDDNKNKGGIPPERLNKVIGQRNEYKEQFEAQQAENERLRQQLEQSQPANDGGAEAEKEAEPSVDDKIKTLVKLQKDALMDDDDEAYEQVTSEIDALKEQKLLDKVAAQNAEKDAAATKKSQESELDQTIDMIQQEYPMLDEASEDFDQDFLEAVSDLSIANRAKGIAPAQALENAVSRAAALKGYTKASEKQKQDADPVEDPRKKTALENAIKTNESQPAALDGKGNRATGVVDAKQLSQEDYEKLPENERAQLLQ